MTIFMAILCRAIMANIDKMVIMAILVWIDMAINMVKYLCLCEEQEKCRYPAKADWKKMH